MAHILVADDDLQIRGLLRLTLRFLGHEVSEARDGGEALQACRTHAFDVVLCDLFMPNKEGLETIRELRREFPGLRIVAMSGGGTGQDGTDALRIAALLGADAVLAKPFSAQEMLAVIGPGGRSCADAQAERAVAAQDMEPVAPAMTVGILAS